MLRQANKTKQTVEDDNMELDIDAVSEPCLNRLYELVIARVPGIVDSIIPSEPTPVRHAPAPKPKKKNKPMGKSEQEQKIAQLKQVVAGGLAGLSSAPTASAATRYGDSGGPGKIMPCKNSVYTDCSLSLNLRLYFDKFISLHLF